MCVARIAAQKLFAMLASDRCLPSDHKILTTSIVRVPNTLNAIFG